MEKLNILKACVKGLSAESKLLKSKIFRNKISNKDQNLKNKLYFNIKNKHIDIRHHTRHYLLAYAFIKNIEYFKLERKCLVKPNADLILNILKNYYYKSNLNEQPIPKDWIDSVSDRLVNQLKPFTANDILLKRIEKWLGQ